MSDLKRYEVVIPSRGGNKVTTLQLTDNDAKARGVFGKHVDESKKKAPANKARRPAANKASKPAAKSAAKPAAEQADAASTDESTSSAAE